MSLELEQSSGDVQAVESSSPAPESTESSPEQTAASTPAETSKPAENTPFHEHPRFKELIDERNTYRQQMSEMQRRLEQMESARTQSQQPVSPQAKVLERLKGIDPEFAQFMEDAYSKASKAEQLEQQLQQLRTESSRKAAVDQLNTLHDQYKVSPELREVYKDVINAKSIVNPNMTLKDLPNVYKEVHDMYSKLLDGVRRAERESYLKDKKAAAATPIAPKGGKAPTTSTKPQYSQNRDEAKQQLIKQIVQNVKAQKAGSSV